MIIHITPVSITRYGMMERPNTTHTYIIGAHHTYLQDSDNGWILFREAPALFILYYAGDILEVLHHNYYA